MEKTSDTSFPNADSLRKFYETSRMFEQLDDYDIPLHYLKSGMRLVFKYGLVFRRHEDYATMYLLTHSHEKAHFEQTYFIYANEDLEKRIKEALHVAGLFVNYVSVQKDMTSSTYILTLDFSLSLSARQSLQLGNVNLEPDALACQKGRTWWDRLSAEEEDALKKMQATLGEHAIRHLFEKTETNNVLWSRGEIRYFFFRNK